MIKSIQTILEKYPRTQWVSKVPEITAKIDDARVTRKELAAEAPTWGPQTREALANVLGGDIDLQNDGNLIDAIENQTEVVVIWYVNYVISQELIRQGASPTSVSTGTDSASLLQTLERRKAQLQNTLARSGVLTIERLDALLVILNLSDDDMKLLRS